MFDKKATVLERRELFRILYRKIFNGHRIAIDFCDSSACLPCHKKNNKKSCPVNKACTDFLMLEQNLTPQSGLSILKNLDTINCKIPHSQRALIAAHWPDWEYEKARQTGVRLFHKAEAKSGITEWIAGDSK